MWSVTREHADLCDTLDRAGPDRPTLCAGWTTADLLAHLLVRERRLDAAAGIVIPALAGHGERVRSAYRARPYAELLAEFRGPAPRWSPFRGRRFRERANRAEYVVHHEDVRRGVPGWAPRPADADRDAAVWDTVTSFGRILYRRSPVGVVIRHGDTEVTLNTRPDPVTLTGAPIESLLHAFGRDQVVLDVSGGDHARAALAATARGI